VGIGQAWAGTGGKRAGTGGYGGYGWEQVGTGGNSRAAHGGRQQGTGTPTPTPPLPPRAATSARTALTIDVPAGAAMQTRRIYSVGRAPRPHSGRVGSLMLPTASCWRVLAGASLPATTPHPPVSWRAPLSIPSPTPPPPARARALSCSTRLSATVLLTLFAPPLLLRSARFAPRFRCPRRLARPAALPAPATLTRR
jgi:hypothetical protein